MCRRINSRIRPVRVIIFAHRVPISELNTARALVCRPREGGYSLLFTFLEVKSGAYFRSERNSEQRASEFVHSIRVNCDTGICPSKTRRYLHSTCETRSAAAKNHSNSSDSAFRAKLHAETSRKGRLGRWESKCRSLRSRTLRNRTYTQHQSVIQSSGPVNVSRRCLVSDRE